MKKVSTAGAEQIRNFSEQTKLTIGLDWCPSDTLEVEVYGRVGLRYQNLPEYRTRGTRRKATSFLKTRAPPPWLHSAWRCRGRISER
jgi:hypothetical protein